MLVYIGRKAEKASPTRLRTIPVRTVKTGIGIGLSSDFVGLIDSAWENTGSITLNEVRIPVDFIPLINHVVFDYNYVDYMTLIDNQMNL